MKKKIVVTFALCGLGIAVVLAVARISLLHFAPLYLYSDEAGWFQILTLVLWPSVFYLTVLQDKEPAKTVFVVWTIAVLFNTVIYAGIGWLWWVVVWLFDESARREGRR